jgi:hypothetical protein
MLKRGTPESAPRPLSTDIVEKVSDDYLEHKFEQVCCRSDCHLASFGAPDIRFRIFCCTQESRSDFFNDIRPKVTISAVPNRVLTLAGC